MSQTGHFVIYHIQKWRIQCTVREALLTSLDDRYLDIIELNINIVWEEEGKEFILNGEFYDVVSIKEINGKTFMYCLNDKKEERLVKNFYKTIKLASDNDTKKSNKVSFKFHVTDQYIIPFISKLPANIDILLSYINYKATLVSNYKEIIIPPPWNATA